MYPVKIFANGTEVSFRDAVQLAMGTRAQVSFLSVTAVYAEDTEVGRDIFAAGEPVVGMDVDLYARRVQFGDDTDATVSIGGISSHSPERAMVRIQAYTLAAQIAAAANAAAAAAKA